VKKSSPKGDDAPAPKELRPPIPPRLPNRPLEPKMFLITRLSNKYEAKRYKNTHAKISLGSEGEKPPKLPPGPPVLKWNVCAPPPGKPENPGPPPAPGEGPPPPFRPSSPNWSYIVRLFLSERTSKASEICMGDVSFNFQKIVVFRQSTSLNFFDASSEPPLRSGCHFRA
jgi:hypothetical protein